MAVALSYASVDDVVVDETMTYVDVTVRLDQPNINVVTVRYTTGNGTAGSGDYVGQSGILTFAPGETTMTVRIQLLSDAVAEGDEAFYVELYSPSANVVIADAFAEVRIGANDGPSGTPVAGIANVVVDEAQGTATFIVSLDRPSTGTVSMDFATHNGTALAGSDYTANSGSLVFAAGETVKTVTVALTNDALDEGSEAFFVELSNFSGATSLVPSASATIGANDSPVVAQSYVAIDDVVVDETGTYADVTVRLDHPNTNVATVRYTTGNGTAGSGDYVGQASFITFAPGETTATVRVLLLPDAVAEGDEAFYVELYSPSANLVIADAFAEVRIGANDAPSGTPVAGIANVVVDEAQGTATFIVSLDRPSTGTVSMDFATHNGTALAGSDYTANSGSLVFAAGETVKTVTVALTNDALDEGSEAFFVELSNFSGATSLVPSASATIGANDSPVVAQSYVAIDDVVVDETGTYADVTVRLDHPNTNVATVRYTTGNGTAGSGDYVGQASFITFAPGETTATVRVLLLPDAVAEGDEAFYVELYSPSANLVIADAFAEVRIGANDAPSGTPVAGIANVVVDEAQGTATFIVSLDRPSTGTVSMDFATHNGTALAGSDYTAASGSLVFAAGETVKTVTVALTNDVLDEGSEAFFVELSNFSGATGGDRMATGVIAPNDSTTVAQPHVRVGVAAIAEDETYVDFVVQLDHPGANVTTVRYTTGNGTAGSGDYVGQAGFITFAPGETTATVRILVREDILSESSETFSLTLYSPSGLVLEAGNATATATIGDDETPAALSLAGSSFSDILRGTAAADTIGGSGSGDFLDGGLGADGMTGNDGDDAYVVDDAGDVVTEAAGEGTDTILSSITHTLVSHVEALILVGGASIDGTGNTLDNTIIGNVGANTLDGAAGADAMAGGLGGDTYIVDNAGDVVTEAAGEGTDTVRSSISYTLTDNVENLVLLGSAAINGTGNALANTLTGNNGANTLDGAGGADAMAGGGGNDTYLVNNAGDVVTEAAGKGTDTVRSSVSYALANNVENLVLLGGAAINGMGNALANTITGNGAANTLNGGGGDDTLDGAAGADIMIGGAGNDTFLVDNAGDALTEAAGEGTDTARSTVSLALANNVENLVLLGAGALNGTGNALANTLTGNGGANTLDGAAGADAMAGGAGDDIYVVDDAGDVVTEAAGDGDDAVRSSIGYTLASNVEKLVLLGTGAINGIGNALVNTLTGNGGANTLDGAAGADTMAGGAGDDTYLVDDAGDVVTETAGKGTDTVRSAISYALASNVENLVLLAGALDGTGNSLGNNLTGNNGANTLDGAAGADTMAGGAGNDVYVVDNAGDVVTEAAAKGTDTVRSSISYTLTDNVEKLVLLGTGAIDGTGNALANTLIGNSGANTLDGAGGADTMAGAAGNDTYIVDDAGDVVTEAAAKGTDTVHSSIDHTLANNVENLVLLGGALNGTGNALANTLTGNGDANTLDGAAGADAMAGDGGDDTYVVDNAGDVVTEASGSGNDTIRSSISLALAGNVENLVLLGTGALNGTGNVLGNNLTGNSGANTLDGAAGADTMAGGAGDDTYIVNHAGDIVTEAAGEGTDIVRASISYALTDNVENLVLLGSSSLSGTGNVLANNLTGNGAANTLDGAAGADAMAGGAGDDSYIVDSAGDVVTEAAGEGTDTVRSSVNHTLAGNVENLVLLGSAGLRGTGNALANNLAGNGGANTLDGAGGADTMAGAAGNDTYIVDDAGDAVSEAAGEGTDTVRSSVDHTLAGNVENLVLLGSAGLKGTGNALANNLTGNGGANTLNGAGGADTLAGAGGNDTYVVDNAGDVVSEAAGEGSDTVRSSISYALLDNLENLVLLSGALDGTGNALDNEITGNDGANALSGDQGADRLIGGSGRDSLYGGVDTAVDRFVFSATGDSVVGANRDKVFDFVSGTDQIDLGAIDADTGLAGNQNFLFSTTGPAAHSVWVVTSGVNLIVRGDVDGNNTPDFEIMIMANASVTQGDFVL